MTAVENAALPLRGQLDGPALVVRVSNGLSLSNLTEGADREIFM